MNSARILHLRHTVQTRGEASIHLQVPGDAVLIKRGRPRWLLLSCPCGCGEEFPINLDSRAGPAWRFYLDKRNKVSVYPSVWRESGCESHYIIWSNKILLFRNYDDYFDDLPLTDTRSALSDAVLDRLPKTGLIEYSEIAEALNEVPWDVLMVCRHLVRARMAREGTGKERGSFGRW